MRFWVFTRLAFASKRGYGVAVEWDAEETYTEVVCPITRQHNSRDRSSRGPLHVTYPGALVPDVFWPYVPDDFFLVQGRVLQRFREEGFNGFDARPVVEARMPRVEGTGTQVPLLWEMRVTGWGGEAADESGVRMTYYCPGCGHVRYSAPDNPAALIDPTKWDGSDFFRVYPLSLYVFVTDRVARLLLRERYRGVRLVGLGDLEFPCKALTPLPPPPDRQVRGPDRFPGVHIAS
jgi:hypothetical protein